MSTAQSLGQAADATDAVVATDAVAATDATATTRMIGSVKIRTDLAAMLGLATMPTTTTSWADQIYTCTYHLPTGRLVLTVQESPDASSANAYFTTLRHQTPRASALTDAKGLGNPGYESPSGIVVILKDGRTLRVDATNMPPVSGPHLIARADLAYEVTTDILGCWSTAAGPATTAAVPTPVVPSLP